MTNTRSHCFITTSYFTCPGLYSCSYDTTHTDRGVPCMKNALLFGSLLYFCLFFYLFGFLSCLVQNHNPQPPAESAARLMHLRVYDNRDRSHQSAPSPSLYYSLTHALRYFGFLSAWPGLQFPSVRPLGLGLLYVYPCNPVCVRRFRSSCFSV